MAARASVLVSGGTGSGKTTTLGALSGAIPASERIVTIEDAAELRLRQRHVVRLEARPPNLEGRGEITIRALVRNALRMRPDRIVVGEVRGAEALDMLQALNTGHDGSLTTVHANSPPDALRRVETLALMAGIGLPHAAVRQQVASAIDLVVQQSRLADGSRVVDSVTEVVRVAGGAGSRENLPPGWPSRAAFGRRALRASRPHRGGVSAGRAPRSSQGASARRLDELGGGAGVAVRRLRRAWRGSPARASRQRGAHADARASHARSAARLVEAIVRLGREGRDPGAAERRGLLLAGAAFAFVAGAAMLGLAAGAGLAAAGPWVVARLLRARRERYRRAVDAGAAQVALAIADAVAGGHSLRGALAEASVVHGAAGHELRRAAAELALGAPTDVALEGMRARVRSERLTTVVVACLLARRAGGDLAQLLRESAARWRSRRASRASCERRRHRRASPGCSWSPCRSAARCSPSWQAPAGSPGYGRPVRPLGSWARRSASRRWRRC